jgi:hypothetical protein
VSEFQPIRKKTFAKGLTIPVEEYTLVNALEGSTNDPNAPNLDKSIV